MSGLSILKDLFPNIPEQILAKCLVISNNNIEVAIEKIVNFIKSQQEQEGDEEKENERIRNDNSNISFVVPAKEYGGKCNYCNKSKTGRISYGMEAQKMTVQDYQALIDLGWRRSGTWLYVPSNKSNECCCKQYTIRLDVDKFEANKSQLKVKRKVEHFVEKGVALPSDAKKKDESTDNVNNNNNNNNDNKDKTSIKEQKDNATPDTKRLKQSKTSGDENIEKLQKALEEAVKEVKSTIPSFPSNAKFPILVNPIPPKLASRGNYSTNVAIVMAGVATPRDAKGSNATPEQKAEAQKKRHEVAVDIANKISNFLAKDLGASVYEDAFINFKYYAPNLEGQTTKHESGQSSSTHKEHSKSEASNQTEVKPHKWTVEMVPATFIEEEYEVYRKYQINVHHDKPEKLTKDGYTNFLVTSPLISEKIEGSDQKYGSFHMQYRVDGKLIAVGVVDVLPLCLSSVYFFYDPDFHSLSLGVYSALTEIDWIKNIHLTVPNLKYYYMGFYIHTCSKMRYKGDYHPSDLLCLSSLQWVPLADCVPLLESTKDYTPFVSDSSKYFSLSEQQIKEIIANIKILLRGDILYLKDLNARGKQIVEPLLRVYLDKVGPELAGRMFFVVR